ncbi:MAG: FeoB-associated Cys-rich membrane protein [Clostridia bacterium]|jgi:positive regulator of sigma E activity|nr:FeoB-associated Cys-rich membrane protein [Clostridia bacterium]
MLSYFFDNLSTIGTLILLIGIVALVVRSMVKTKRNNHSACGNCPNANACRYH